MNIYTLLSSGKYHPINGEDYQYQVHLGDKWFVGAVMDGCSSGKESYFASTLYAKSLHKACRVLPGMKEIMEEFDIEKMEKEAILEFILGQLFEDIKKVKKALFLDIEEVLSTILIMIYDKENQSALIIISGDGLVACNGKLEEIDQNNIPDYLGYHLDVKFDEWYKNHTKSMIFKNVQDISISTDGLIKLRKNPAVQGTEIDPLEAFLIRPPQLNEITQLQNQYQKLIDNDQYIPFDDISVIRLIS